MTDEFSLFHRDIFLLIRDISFGFLFVPVLSTFLRWKLLSKSQKGVAIIAILSLMVEVLTRYLSKNKINSVSVFHVYMPLLFTVVMGVYFSAKVRVVQRKGFKLVLVLFYAVILFNTVWLQPFNSFNTNVIALASFVFIVLSIVYFYRLIQASSNEYFLQDPILWFSVGNLLYYSSMFILFVVVQKILNNRLEALYDVWILNAIFLIVLSICYSIALWVRPKT